MVAAEDYTGASPVQAGGPNYLDFYTDALDANGVAHDVYDIDANGRKAPDNLGVLSHYDAVIWYTGDDIVTREPGWGPGNASRLAVQTLFEIRDFMNAGGRAVYTGQFAGQQFSASFGTFLYDPFENQQCRVGAARPRAVPAAERLAPVRRPERRHRVLARCRDDDTRWRSRPGVGRAAADQWHRRPARRARAHPQRPRQRGQPEHRCVVRRDDPPAVAVRPGAQLPAVRQLGISGIPAPVTGSFDPHTGSKLMWAGLADEGYKRLTRTITVPAGGGSLSFWTSYHIEQDFDYMIVEARTAGRDDWTTLPDVNGNTTSDLSADQACTNGWSSTLGPEPFIHPFLTHYQTHNEDGTCYRVGTSGEWNALNGFSDGWTELEFDLSAYAGGDVEISITVLSDWGFQEFPGVVIDDVTLPDGSSTSFEDDAGGWAPSGAPQDADGIEGANANDWTRRGGLGVLNGAAISTPDSVYLGFGFEGVSGAAARNTPMDRLVDYLLR